MSRQLSINRFRVPPLSAAACHRIPVSSVQTITFSPYRSAVSSKGTRFQRSYSPRRIYHVLPLATASDIPPEAATTPENLNFLPISPVIMVNQAAASVSAALDQGILRQQVDFLLPVNEKERSFTATEPDDYPCSLKKEFDTACDLTTSLLQRVIGDSNATIAAKRLDDGGIEGEPCTVLYPKDTKHIAAVVFPTAERLKNIKDLAKEASRPLLIINPQWREAGQIISDFGIGPWKAEAMAFLSEFKPIYLLKETRIGSPGTINMATQSRYASGGVVRIHRHTAGIGEYDVYAMAADGSSQLLGSRSVEPNYQELDGMIRDGRAKGMEIFSIARRVTRVQQEDGSLNVTSNSVAVIGSEPESFSAGDIDMMDKASLQRKLSAMGMPTSGKLSSLRDRVKEALAQEQERE